MVTPHIIRCSRVGEVLELQPSFTASHAQTNWFMSAPQFSSSVGWGWKYLLRLSPRPIVRMKWEKWESAPRNQRALWNTFACTCTHTKALYKLLSTVLVLTWANQAARVASVKHTSGCVALSSATLQWLSLFKDRLGDLTLQPPLQFWPTGPQDRPRQPGF